MHTKSNRFFAFILVLTFVSMACGLFSPKATPTPLPTSTSALTNTPSPSRTPAPTATVQLTVNLGPQHRSEQGGFSYQAIPGYDVQDLFGFVTMQPKDADPNLGPTILMIGEQNTDNKTPEELFADFKKDLDATIIDESPVVFDGLPGYSANLEGMDGEKNLKGRVVLVASPKQVFTMFGGCVKERWAGEISPLYQAVLLSVRFFDPIIPTTQATPETPLGSELRQWAVSAAASSEFTETSWSASQATGKPNTPACGDQTTAWAPLESTTIEWIELSYTTPVIVSMINIIQTYNPSQVVKVELIDLTSGYHEVYTSKPKATTACPYTLSIPVTADYMTAGLRITIDQTVLQAWNEIDAVELVGLPEEQATPIPPEAPIPWNATFAWRKGGANSTAADALMQPEGMDTTSEGLLYIADELNGIHVFDADGNSLQMITHPDLTQASDVKAGPDGNIYVAAWGPNQVFVFTPDGNLVNSIGSTGSGDGQFGTFSPTTLAVSSKGYIYALDVQQDNDGNDVYRVEVFNSDGAFIQAFPLDDPDGSPEGMDFGPDGNLYIADSMGGYLMMFSPTGERLGEFGKAVLEFTGPRGVAIDYAGNFYITTWFEFSILKLDSSGKVIGKYGTEVSDGDNAWAEGGFYSISGIAVLPDGSRVFVSDWSSKYAYVTAFEYK